MPNRFYPCISKRITNILGNVPLRYLLSYENIFKLLINNSLLEIFTY